MATQINVPGVQPFVVHGDPTRSPKIGKNGGNHFNTS